MLRIVVFNKSMNKEAFETCPTRPLAEDLVIGLFDERMITHSDLEKSGMTEDEAFTIAMENTKANGFFTFHMTPNLKAVTAPGFMFGAAILAFPDILAGYMGEKGEYIIPSSIHEIIITSGFEVDEIAENIREINDSDEGFVKPWEILGYRPLKFDRATGKLEYT